MVSDDNQGPGRVVQKGREYELVQEGKVYITLVKELEMSLLLPTNSTSASTVHFANRFVSFCTIFFFFTIIMPLTTLLPTVKQHRAEGTSYVVTI
jgi:hypothetical protein